MSEREDANGNSLPQRRLFYRVLLIVGNDVVEGVGSPDRAPERCYATMVHTRQSHVVFDVYLLGKTIRSIKEER
jgi:hypothetical protein